MKTKFLIMSVATVLLCLGSGILASAQRTSDRSILLDISPKVSCYSIPSGGLSVSAGQYLLNSYWVAGVSATHWNQKAAAETAESSDVCFDHLVWNINAGWMYRIISTYSRWFNVYIGILAFLGSNHYEVFREIPDELYHDHPKMEFIYGVEPGLDAEFYISQRVAITFGLQGPVTFSSSLESDIFRLTGSLGIRINL